MKKSLIIFGLFSLMMVLTSFTSPIGGGRNSGGEIAYEIGGGRNSGGEIAFEIGGGRNSGGE